MPSFFLLRIFAIMIVMFRMESIMNKLDEGLFEFAEVPLKESLEQFMSDNEMKSFNNSDHSIEYYDCGDSETLIMMIPSSNGSAITFFKYMEELRSQFRVIVPNYEAGVNLEKQCLGFLALADSIPHKKLIVFGYSFGGVIAQVMTKLKPNKIDGFCLLDSETKTSHIHPSLVKKFVKSYKRLNRTLKHLSVKWMHQSLAKRISFDVKMGLDENKHFWEALYKQLLFETDKERMRLIYDNVREFWMDYELSKDDFSSYNGNVLILNVEGSIARVEVKELEEVYENAEVITYNEGFRMSLIKCYNGVVFDLSRFAEL